jgi:hypothetical protein
MTDRGEVRTAERGLSPPARAYRLAAIGLTAVAADVALDPEHRHVPLCPFHAMTGGQCPLCGGLRAVDALVHGRLVSALHDNLLVVAAVPVAVMLWLVWLVQARTGRTGPAWPRAATVAVIALGLCFTVVRNLPFASGLRP